MWVRVGKEKYPSVGSREGQQSGINLCNGLGELQACTKFKEIGENPIRLECREQEGK